MSSDAWYRGVIPSTGPEPSPSIFFVCIEGDFTAHRYGDAFDQTVCGEFLRRGHHTAGRDNRAYLCLRCFPLEQGHS